MQGQIIKIIAGFYDIECEKKIYRVRGSGKLRNEKVTPVVGDFVEFIPNQFLLKLFPRKNFLVRPKVANIDQAFIVMSLKKPDFSDFLLDKFLTILKAKQITPIILLTKIDLVKNNHNEAIYKNQGYTTFVINNYEFEAPQLLTLFSNKTSVFIGQSGVGKSSTINNIANLSLATQKVSSKLNRGKHTTRVVEMLDFANGKIIDTPGFSSIDFDLTKLQVAHFFDNFQMLLKNCQFSKNCLHFHEEKCGVKTALAQKKLSKSSYENYLKLLKEAK